jgi:hypothetical protein
MPEQPLDTELLDLLDRRASLDALGALRFALRPTPSGVKLSDTAIAFDANVFLRVGTERRNDDVIDYLRSTHKAPLIVPGQVIQEFWNNQFAAVKSMAGTGREHLARLKSEIDKFDTQFGEFAARFEQLLEEFSTEFGYLFDPATLSRTDAFLDVLVDRASVPFVERTLFYDVAKSRDSTKTPPGFRDPADGDFYVWADLLRGLQTARDAGASFGNVVLVSQDRKIDWSREGTPHPILAAEIRALTGVGFEIWTVEQLRTKVSEAIGSA